MKKILLLEPDKKQSDLFASWLKEEGYEITALLAPDEAINIISKDSFDLFIIDIDNPQITDKYLTLCQTIKQDPRAQDLPVTVLTYKKDVEKITAAITAGADNFVLKPFETGEFLLRIEFISKEIDLKKQGKKVLDLNYINYLIALAGDMERKDFFLLSPIIFNCLIIKKISAILGEPVIVQIIKRANETTGVDYPFMKDLKYSGLQLLMDSADRVSQGVPVEKLTLAFRDYTYAFLHMVMVLTSDILMERGGGVLNRDL